MAVHIVILGKLDKCRNGVTAPRDGSICRELWDRFAIVVNKHNRRLSNKEMVEELVEWYNDNTISTQYSRWLHYTGLI